MELFLQVFGTLFVLVLIVFMIYRTYTDPHSEYGRLLDEIPDSYSHLNDEALYQEAENAKKELHKLESELSRLRSSKRAKRHRLRKKIAAIKIALLHYEQTRRTTQADKPPTLK
ncbi:MAG: hypothetical protein U9Q62_07895 [Campylobacterota bacterium]|nr:hypothetical protein [Campylobacterota bacterium]